MTVSEDALATLKQKWNNEQQNIQQAQRRLARLQEEIRGIEPEQDEELWRYKALITTCLSDSYSGIERTLKEVVKQLDNRDPESDEQWHKQLVESVSNDTANREAVLSEEGKQAARQLIEFRHMDRFNYPQDIRWKELMAAIDSYDNLFPTLMKEVVSYMNDVEKRITAEILSSEDLQERDGLDIGP